MGKLCCVPFCSSTHNSTDISFHEFPSDLAVREKWLKVISRGRTNKYSSPWLPHDRDVVCSLHFKAEDYKETSKTRRLLQWATPSIFPGYPKYKLENKQIERKPPPSRTAKRKLNYSIEFPIEDEEVPSPRKMKFCSPQRPQPDNEITFESKYETGLNKLDCNRQRKTYCQTIRRKNNRIAFLSQQVVQLKRQLNGKKSQLMKNIDMIEKDANDGESKAAILLEQISNYGKKNHKWSEFLIRMAILFRSKSPKGYDTARCLFLNLPSRMTLQRYIGPSRLLVGFTPLIAARLKDEFAVLKQEEIFASLIFDEMSISPEVKYMRQADKIVGKADLGKDVTNSAFVPVANRLLCFVLKGLSTNYKIPVSYYLTKQLQGEQLAKVILNVIKAVENVGFKICRLVGDCLSVNVKAYGVICNGPVTPRTIHPMDPERPLFISYDACHVLKNLRNQLLDESRKMKNGKSKISGDYIRKLYNIQKNMITKPVRYLTRKVVYPTNFEKMNVSRAVKVFSTETIAAIKLGAKNRTPGFTSTNATIEFMENVKKWFDIQNIGNKTHHIKSRNTNKAPFELLDDTRLSWLEKDFMEYLENWKKSIKVPPVKGKKPKWPSHFLTKETYKALVITTLSTVECTRYLLKEGFLFVLTRKFTSDDVENLFSAVRLFQGANDKANAVGAIYAIEKILKIGLMSSSVHSNVGSEVPISAILKSQIETAEIFGNPKEIALNDNEKRHAEGLKNPKELQGSSNQAAGIVVIAGFLVRLVHDKHPCPKATEIIKDVNKQHKSNIFISLQDRGGLFYPTAKLSGFVKAVYDILSIRQHEQHQVENLVNSWVITLKNFTGHSTIRCGCGSLAHKKEIEELILRSIIKNYFVNYCATYTDKEDWPKFQNKPHTRKIQKL